MKKIVKKSLKFTRYEQQRLSSFIHLEDWHFDKLIMPHCIELSSVSIRWTSESKEWSRAVIFGLSAIKTATGKPCVANIFIRYEHRLYQVTNLCNASSLIHLLEREEKVAEFEKRAFRKRLAANRKAAKVKQLKVA